MTGLLHKLQQEPNLISRIKKEGVDLDQSTRLLDFF
jgi:hypothetical protein